MSRIVLALCLVGIAGCGQSLTLEQKAVVAQVQEWGKTNSVDKWWPTVTAEQADFPKLFAEADANKPKGLDADYETFAVMRVQVESKSPTHVIRARVKGPKAGERLFFVANGKVVAVWFPAPDSKLSWLADWTNRNFPG